MLSSQTAAQIWQAVYLLTMDRKNGTTGPGHYNTAALNAMRVAMNRENGINIGRIEYPDYLPLK